MSGIQKNRNWYNNRGGGRGGGGGYQRGNRGGGGGWGWNAQLNRSGINVGMCGFFVTVEGTGQEKPAIREAHNLFDSTIATLPAIDPTETTATSTDTQVESTETPEEALDAADELAAACSAEAAQKYSGHSRGDGPADTKTRITQIQTNVKNCLFFSSTLPVAHIYKVAETLSEQCQARSQCRFVARWLPVEDVCDMGLAQVIPPLERLIHKHFVVNWKGESAPSYALEFKARNNNSLTRSDILTILDDTIKGLAPLARVNLTSPDITILVNVLNTRVLLSAVRRYHALRKYATRPPEEKPADAAVADKAKSEMTSTVTEDVKTDNFVAEEPKTDN